MFILLENPRSGWVFRVKHWTWMSRKQLETVGNSWKQLETVERIENPWLCVGDFQ